MKNILLGVFTFCVTFSCFSQKAIIPAKIIINNNDTLKVNMQVVTNIFDRTLVDESSFYKAVKVLDSTTAKKSKIKAVNIKQLYFKDLKGEDNIYINDGKQLQKQLYIGKISLYSRLSYNNYTMTHNPYLLNEEGEKFNLTLFNNKKKQLIKAIEKDEKLVEKVEQLKPSDIDVIKILKEYNANN